MVRTEIWNGNLQIDSFSNTWGELCKFEGAQKTKKMIQDLNNLMHPDSAIESAKDNKNTVSE